MVRIVGVQRSSDPNKEFVLLQNQGALRASLRGHIIVSESSIDHPESFHFFTEDVLISPGHYALLRSGKGRNGWGTSKDGAQVFFVSLTRENSLWGENNEPIHLMNVQHTYSPRQEAALLV